MQVKALATGLGSSSSSYFPLFLFSLNIFDFNNETQQLQCNLKHTEHFNIKQGDVKKAFHFVKVNKFHGPANSCCHLFNNGVLYSIIFLKSLYRHTTHLLFWRTLFYCLFLRLVIPKLKKNKKKKTSLVALTLVVMKVQKLVKSEILKKTEHVLDLLYRPHRGMEDAAAILLNLVI